MVTLIKRGANYNSLVSEIDGLSTESKPTTRIEGRFIENGSVYTEIDTGKQFMYDEENRKWYEVNFNGSGSIDTSAYATSLAMTINPDTYVLSSMLKNEDGDTLGTPQTIDLPLETMVVGGSYDDTTKKVILTLKNGNTVDFSVADLVDGLQPEITSSNKLNSDLVDDTNQNNKFVTSAEKEKINNAIVEEVYNAGKQVKNGNDIGEKFNDYTYNRASGHYSHAEGGFTTASGSQSHAEGFETIASGVQSHAEGSYTTASGYYSHAEGSYTTASGFYSHAEGSYTTASRQSSHAEGERTKASSANQHVQGKYNIEDSNDKYAFIIGNGTANDNRSNAFAVDWNGLIYVNNASTGVDVSGLLKGIDQSKINVIDNGVTVHTFNDIASAATYIKSNTLFKFVVIGSNAGVTSIENNAFVNCPITDITIPEGVTSIGDSAFRRCTFLKTIIIPEGVTSIGSFAFEGCSALEYIYIPDGVTSISNNTFENCDSLQYVDIPDSVTFIDSVAFRNCRSLEYIYIPEGVTSIGDSAFEGCSSLTEIEIPEGTSIDSNAFKECDILALEPYKNKTGYPWGATDIYIKNEDVATIIDSSSTDRQVPTAKAVYTVISDIKSMIATTFGFRINKNDMNPNTRVEYLYDAVGMNPAYMDFTNGVFNYGDWGSAWFVADNRPVALQFDGTVDYELDHSDFTKKLDGTASDITDTTYSGNFMSEIPLVYIKRWEDENYNYIAISNNPVDDSYKAYAHTNANGIINPKIYLPMFKGSVVNNKLRSIAGQFPTGSTTGSQEVSYAEACGSGWQLWDWSKHELIADLLTLISRSTDSKGKFGNGDINSYRGVSPDYGKQPTGGYCSTVGNLSTFAVDSTGQFYGKNDDTHHVTAFYIEDFWGNRFDRCLGLNLDNNVYKVKMIPPYALDTDSTYTTVSSVSVPSNDWLKNISTGDYGGLPSETGATQTTGFCNYFYNSSSSVRLALLGGNCINSSDCGYRCGSLEDTSSDSGWSRGGSPCFNPL